MLLEQILQISNIIAAEASSENWQHINDLVSKRDQLIKQLFATKPTFTSIQTQQLQNILEQNHQLDTKISSQRENHIIS